MFRITIAEVTEQPTTRRSWEKFSDTPNEKGEQYRYATYPGVESVERKVLTQELDAVDIPAVIKALNGL